MSPAATDALILASEILEHVPPTALKSRPPLRSDQTASSEGSAVAFAYNFYGIPSADMVPSSSTSMFPFVAALEDVLFLTTAATKALLSLDQQTGRTSRDILQQSLELLNDLVERLKDEAEKPFVIQWDPAEWLSTLLMCLQKKASLYVGCRTLTLSLKTGHDIQHPRPADCFSGAASPNRKA